MEKDNSTTIFVTLWNIWSLFTQLLAQWAPFLQLDYSHVPYATGALFNLTQEGANVCHVLVLLWQRCKGRRAVWTAWVCKVSVYRAFSEQILTFLVRGRFPFDQNIPVWISLKSFSCEWNGIYENFAEMRATLRSIAKLSNIFLQEFLFHFIMLLVFPNFLV